MSSTSASSSGRRASGAPRRREHRWAIEIPLILWLVLVWAVLWGELTAKNLLVGLVLSLLVTRALALPPVQLSSRFNVIHGATLFFTFLWQVTRASFEVMWTVIAQGPRATSAVTAVKMRSRSDLIMTATGSTTGLIPGSVLLEVDRTRAVLYFHVLDVDDEEDVEHFRESVRNTEAAWTRMMGSPEDYDALRREDAERGRARSPRAVLRSWTGFAREAKAARGGASAAQADPSRAPRDTARQDEEQSR